MEISAEIDRGRVMHMNIQGSSAVPRPSPAPLAGGPGGICGAAGMRAGGAGRGGVGAWANGANRGRGAVGSIDYRDRHGECGVCRRTAIIWRGGDAGVGARATGAARARDRKQRSPPHVTAPPPRLPRCGLQRVGCCRARCKGGAGGWMWVRCKGDAREMRGRCQLIIREIPDTCLSIRWFR